MLDHSARLRGSKRLVIVLDAEANILDGDTALFSPGFVGGSSSALNQGLAWRQGQAYKRMLLMTLQSQKTSRSGR